MSQASPTIADGNGGLVRSGFNAALAAIVSGQSGTGRPSYAAAGTSWWDTDTPGGGVWTLNYYDGTSDVAIGTFDTGTHAFVLAAPVASATPALSDNSKKLATTEYADRQVGQVVTFETGAVATGSTGIPSDDTIPQSTEGDQYMSLSITPKSATSKLIIEVVAFLTSSYGGGAFNIIGALFQDSGVNAIAAGWVGGGNAVGAGRPLVIRHVLTSGTTSSTTFKFRAGNQASIASGNSITLNGTGVNRSLGGVFASSITIREVL
jgi:hypothetical protein